MGTRLFKRCAPRLRLRVLRYDEFDDPRHAGLPVTKAAASGNGRQIA